MSKSNVNLSKLAQQSDELYSLIRATNGILQDSNPISELRVDFEEKVSDLAPEVFKLAKYAVAAKVNPKAIIPVTVTVAAVAAVGWVGATGIDVVRNGVAKSQAKKALLGYYQQLSTKQNMIIKEQQRVNQEMAKAIEQFSQNEEEYREKIRVLQQRQAEITELMRRFNNLKNQVEK